MKSFVRSLIHSFLPAIAVLLQVHFAIAQTAVLLPNGEQQFFDNNGNPLTSGTVDFYAPNTTNRMTTWKNSGETIVNTNPVVLDAAGRAIIYGQGTYRQVVKDSLGNLIWDQLTTGPGTSGAAVTNFGDGNAVGTVKMWAGIVAPAQYQFAYGQQVLRASFPDLYSAITQTISVICTSGSAVLSGITDTTQIAVGANVETSCVPGTGTVIATTASTVTLSSTANISTTVNATFFPFGNGNGATTFALPDLRGYVMAGRDNMGGTAASRLTATYFGKSAGALGATGGSQNQTLTLAEMVGHTHNAIVNDPGHDHGIVVDSVAAGPNITSGGASSPVATFTDVAATGITIANDYSGGGISISASRNEKGGIGESSSIVAGGTGYTSGASKVFTTVGGTCSVQPALNVTVSGGIVTHINSVDTAGVCTVYPTNPAHATPPSGPDANTATFNLAFVGTSLVTGTVQKAGTSGYTTGNVTILGGVCSTQPVASIIAAGGVVTAVASIITAGICSQFPISPVQISTGSGDATLNIPFNPGGTAYTNGARVVTAQGGTCTVQPQFNATVVNNQITTIGAQVAPSNCSIAPSDPAPIVDAGGVAASATLITGGSSYTNGAQVLTVLGGTCTTQPQFNVNVSANVIASVTSLATAGACTINPSNPVATSGGGGIGATLSVTYTVVGSGASANVVYGPQSFATIQPTLTMNYVVKVLPDSAISTTNVVTSINSQTGAFSCTGLVTCSANTISVSTTAGIGIIPTNAPYNCVGNGIADDTVCMQNALNASTIAGVPLLVGWNNTKYLITSTLTNAGVVNIQGFAPVGNDGVGNAQRCLNGLTAEGHNITLLNLTGPKVIIHDLCMQMGTPGVLTGGAGAAILLGGSDQGHDDITGNTIFWPVDGIQVAGAGGLVRASNISQNVIRSPSRYGIAIGMGTTAGATAGITMIDNQIGCDVGASGVGLVIFDGAVVVDGTTNGPNNCLYGTVIAPGNLQNVNGEFRGVMGDSNVANDLLIAPTETGGIVFGGTVNFLDFTQAWAAAVGNNTSILINCPANTLCEEIRFNSMTAHGGLNQTVPIVDIERGDGGPIHLQFSNSTICSFRTAGGGEIALKLNVAVAQPAYWMINNNKIGQACDGGGGGSATPIGISLAIAGSTGNILITGNSIISATALSYTPAATDNVIISNNLGIPLPTSCTNRIAGTIWNNSNVVNVCP